MNGIAAALAALAKELKAAGINNPAMLALEDKADGLKFMKVVRDQDDPATREVVLGRFVEDETGAWLHSTINGVEIVWPAKKEETR